MSKPPFDRFLEYRPHQEDAVMSILSSPAKVVILEGPTGSGKSLIGMSAAKRDGEKDRRTADKLGGFEQCQSDSKHRA